MERVIRKRDVRMIYVFLIIIIIIILIICFFSVRQNKTF
jgi:hypothetical protein